MKKIRSLFLQLDIWADQVIKLVLQKRGYKLTKNNLKSGTLIPQVNNGKTIFDVFVDNKNFEFSKIG